MEGRAQIIPLWVAVLAEDEGVDFPVCFSGAEVPRSR
jgi:hypothetical protein